MKKLLTFILSLLFCTILYSQSTIVPPKDAKNPNTILQDVNFGDSVRIVYGRTSHYLVKTPTSLEQGYSDPIAVKYKDVIYYGFAVCFPDSKPAVVKNNGRCLIKTKDGSNYEAKILYGCQEETHQQTEVQPNYMVTGSVNTYNVNRSNICAHIILNENDFSTIISGKIEKVRLETTTGYVDFEFSVGQPTKNVNKIFPDLKTTINNKSEGFSSNF